MYKRMVSLTAYFRLSPFVIKSFVLHSSKPDAPADATEHTAEFSAMLVVMEHVGD